MRNTLPPEDSDVNALYSPDRSIWNQARAIPQMVSRSYKDIGDTNCKIQKKLFQCLQFQSPTSDIKLIHAEAPINKERVSTHLVDASTGSTAQPPCRRGGLGGGSFNKKKKRSFTASSCQANSYTSSTHTQATIYQTDGEIMLKVLLIHKIKDI